jgi:hypothetical protein
MQTGISKMESNVNTYLFLEHFIEFVEFIVPPEYKPAMVVTCHHHFVNLQEISTKTNITILP